MKRVVLLAAVALLLAGCGRDYGACLKSHQEHYTWLLPLYIGSVNGAPMYTYLPMDGVQEACDLWEFPEGRK